MARRPPAQGWRKRGSGALAVRALQTAQRDREAVALRKEGLTYDQISARLGYGHRSSARKAVERGLDLFRPESTNELRRLELAILDELTGALFRSVAPGTRMSGKVADLILAVIDRRILLVAVGPAGFEPDTASWSYDDFLEQATSSTGGPWTDVLAARAANMTFDEIATKFNLGNRATARRRVDTDFRNYSRGVADVYLADTLRTLDQLHAAHWAAATATPPDHKAVRIVLKVHDQRAKLLGLHRMPSPHTSARTTREAR